jgi:hypothetical protein
MDTKALEGKAIAEIQAMGFVPLYSDSWEKMRRDQDDGVQVGVILDKGLPRLVFFPGCKGNGTWCWNETIISRYGVYGTRYIPLKETELLRDEHGVVPLILLKND